MTLDNEPITTRQQHQLHKNQVYEAITSAFYERTQAAALEYLRKNNCQHIRQDTGRVQWSYQQTMELIWRKQEHNNKELAAQKNGNGINNATSWPIEGMFGCNNFGDSSYATMAAATCTQHQQRRLVRSKSDTSRTHLRGLVPYSIVGDGLLPTTMLDASHMHQCQRWLICNCMKIGGGQSEAACTHQ